MRQQTRGWLAKPTKPGMSARAQDVTFCRLTVNDQSVPEWEVVPVRMISRLDRSKTSRRRPEIQSRRNKTTAMITSAGHNWSFLAAVRPFGSNMELGSGLKCPPVSSETRLSKGTFGPPSSSSGSCLYSRTWGNALDSLKGRTRNMPELLLHRTRARNAVSETFSIRSGLPNPCGPKTKISVSITGTCMRERKR
jgi:hypothetical protein